MAPLWAMRRIKEDHLTSNLISDLANHIDDVIGDKAISFKTGTTTYEDCNLCKHCGHAGKSQPEIQHDRHCPVGWFQDLADDVRNPKPKETK